MDGKNQISDIQLIVFTIMVVTGVMVIVIADFAHTIIDKMLGQIKMIGWF